MAVVVLAGLLVAMVGYWLETSGVTATSVQPAPGLNAAGGIADVANLSTTVTGFGNGNATTVTGIAVAKITIASGYTNSARVGVSWTDPQDASRVLNNPHAQIYFGLYRPVATTTGTCTTPGTVLVVDTTSYCTVLDTGATGSDSVFTTGGDAGRLFLSSSLLTGYLNPSVDGSASEATCAADNGSASAWCQPSGLGASQRRLFVVASITVPGGTPRGQQSQLTTLQFNVSVLPQ